MAHYNNFQSQNKKYSRTRDNYNPAFNSTVSAKGEHQQTALEKNLNKYVEFLSWCRFYPDLFLDLVKPEKGGIILHPDQRTFLRCIVRFVSVYGVFPRGWGKTFDEILAAFLVCMFFPGVDVAITAQTKENAANILEDKYLEIIKYYPMLANEVIKPSFSKNVAVIPFVNLSKIDILANAQSSKGQRRKRISIEESALLNNALFEDALEPIVVIPRNTVGQYAIVDPEELNQQINFFTTAGYRASDEYVRSLNMYTGMTNLTGEFLIGSDWHLGCWYGRGDTKSQILKKKQNISAIAFAQNYASKWVGTSDNALVDINKLLNCRTISTPEHKSDGKSDYILGIDVARSVKSGNNITAVAPIKIIRYKTGKIKELRLVNIYEISGNLNFTAQAVEVKKIKKLFNATTVCVDSNGLGIGLVDELLKESLDPNTGESLGCWATLNTDAQPEINDYERCIYDLKPQSSNNEIIVNFISIVDSEKFRMLIKKQNSDYDINDSENQKENVLPFVLTDYLIEETANLQAKTLPNGKLTLEKTIKKYDKDKFSAVAYGLWYAKTFEDRIDKDDDNIEDILACMSW